MSWSTVCLWVNQGGRGYWSGFPRHDGNRARDLLEALGRGDFAHSRFASFELGLRPPAGYFCIGAYEKGLLLSGLDDLYGAVEQPERPFLTRCLAHFPGAEALLLELSGTVNLAAYAMYVDGRRRRAFLAAGARGLVLDEGTPEPEELALLQGAADSEARARMGESLAFALSARFLGEPLDRFAAERLSVELIRTPRSGGAFSALRRLLGGSESGRP